MAFDISSFGIAESSLPNGWKTDRIGLLADINPEQVGRAYPHSTIAYLDIGNVASGSIGQPETIPIHNAPSRAKRLFRSGDIIISTVRPGNRAYAFMRETPENLVVSTGFAVLRAKDSVNPRFLYHLVTSKPLIEYWASIADEKSAYPSINPSDIAECVVPIPPPLEQNTIAHILGALDEKIDLNRRINQTLEAMAQAIFKSWFVDFDPVKAKIAAIEQGQDPLRAAMRAISGKTDAELDQMPREHHDQLAAIAALFPDAMEESELGEIPKGWRVRQLPDVIDFLEGPGIRNWQYTEAEDGIKFINIRCIKDGDLKLDTANKITQEEAFGKYSHFQLSEDDIVISISGTLGRFGFVRKSHLPLSLNTSVVRFRAIQNVSTLHFIAGFVDTQLQSELEIRASGSAQRNFGPMHLKQIELLLPEYQVLKAHAEIVEHLFRKRQKNLEQIDNLTQLRDSLLPKLLSGELRMEATEM